MTDTNGLSFIEPHEEEAAKEYIKEHLVSASGLDDFEPPRPAGYHMAVKLYIRSEDVHGLKDDAGNAIIGADGKPMFIALPASVTTNDKWRTCVALVVAQGPEAYQGDRFKRSGPWCKVGDWVVLPRNEGTQINYRGIPMQIIPDDRVLAIVEDPTYVTRD